MRSAIISENMQLVAGDFNSGAGATPGGWPELCGSLKPPHSHCWKITNMVPGVSTWPGSPRGRLRVPACLGKMAVLDITRFCKSITYDASWSGLLECLWCTFLGPFGRRIGEVRLQPLQRVDGWYLRRRVLLLQSTCGYKLTKDGTEFFHRYGILTSAKYVGSTPGSPMRPWIILMAWGLPRSSKQCSQLNMSDADDKACIAQSGEHKSR